MPRYRLWIEYDGTDFFGWQAQKEGNSVQQALSDAIFAYCQERVALFGAGRTDSGVHALVQQAHLDLARDKPGDELCAAVNFHLRREKKQVALLAVEKTDENFHARFSAEKRHYTYMIIHRKARSILWQNRAWHIDRRLDIEAMRQAADLFIGVHDFTTFRAASCQAKSPVKTLDRLTVSAKKEWIWIKASARSFLQHQIRSLTGALVAVGSGRINLTEAEHILKAADRRLCPPIAPPGGLYLTHIDYPAPYHRNPYPNLSLEFIVGVV